MGMDQDDVGAAPYSTVVTRWHTPTPTSSLRPHEDMTDNATDEITEILRRNHKLKESYDDDFTIRSQQQVIPRRTPLPTRARLLACIAGISLVVGGIGIHHIHVRIGDGSVHAKWSAHEV